jgi:hypothetical protein
MVDAAFFSGFFCAWMGPYNLLSQIDTVHNAAVKSENIEIDPAGTGSNHEGIDSLAGYILLE